MDTAHFDRLVSSFGAARARRTVLRALGVGALAALLGRSAEPAGAINADGAKCKRSNQCGSGLCQKQGKKKKGKKPKKRCQFNAEARGCTIEDQCGLPCPDFPDGICGVTVGGKGGKPFCATAGGCIACTSDEDCETTQQRPGARCVHCPDVCEHTNSRSCVWFDPV